ncbi:YecA family protein [Phaeobacter sp. CAU 1743]|uniref:YecA/YgfB family protein n=1 Tax=Phaeobacter sp. CAU 1743 TaxID=3140367 RepID=UPI00325AB43A
MSDDSPEDCMMLSDLDGFLHGVVCSPAPISREEWLRKALGDAPDNLPKWVVETVDHLHGSIAKDLASSPSELSPIFWESADGHVIAMDWCEGFMEAVSLRPRDWLKLTASREHGHLMTPIIVHLFDDSGQSLLGIPEDELPKALDEAAKAIPTTVVGVHEFWKPWTAP